MGFKGAKAFEEYDTSVIDQITKIKSAGDPTVVGSPAWYTAKYAYTPSKLDALVRAMGFKGTAPEVVNGRLAMLALVAGLGEELVSGKPIGQQVVDQYFGIALTIAAVTSGSLVPLVKGVEVKHADLGPFKSVAEKLNG